MKRMRSAFFLFFISASLLFLPVGALAAVRINEIAWMGTEESANGEWLELFNDGAESVDLKDWKILEGGGETVLFTLTKTIEPQGLLVVERITPSVPDPLTGVNDESGSFGGSGLNNVGEHLVLRDISGGEVQNLNFADGWPAGDKTTKQTMQWNGQEWITASATPRTINSLVDSSGEEEDAGGSEEADTGTVATTSDSVPVSSSSGGNSSWSSHSGQADLSKVEDEKILIGAGRKRLGTIYNPLEFRAEGEHRPVNMTYVWSFGDGSESGGEKTTHTYLFPGKYQVVLHAFAGDGRESVSRTEVRVLAPEIRLGRISPTEGFAEVQNFSADEVNLFGWNLGCGERHFSFPRDTIIAPKETLKLPLILTECLASTTVWSLDGGGKVITVINLPINDPNRELTLIAEQIERIAAEVALFPTVKPPELANNDPMPDSILNLDQKIDSADISVPVDQAASVIILDKKTAPSTSLWSRFRSIFQR